MVDIVSKAVRSRMMSGIRGHDTQPELALRRCLFTRGFRFRLHVRTLPGKPDLVLPRYRAVIFVHGCFWHQHPGCRYATTPASNRQFWQKKFSENLARDNRAVAALDAMGWRVRTVWECELATTRVAATCDEVADWLSADGQVFSAKRSRTISPS